MWQPRRLTTLWASPACYRNSFTLLFTFQISTKYYQYPHNIHVALKQNTADNTTCIHSGCYNARQFVAIVSQNCVMPMINLTLGTVYIEGYRHCNRHGQTVARELHISQSISSFPSLRSHPYSPLSRPSLCPDLHPVRAEGAQCFINRRASGNTVREQAAAL
jgi:hypothetical protein